MLVWVLWVLWLFLTRCGAYSLAHWAKLLPLPRNASRCEVVAKRAVRAGVLVHHGVGACVGHVSGGRYPCRGECSA